MGPPIELDLADCSSCPCCGSGLIADNRCLDRDRWLVRRGYVCGCEVSGVVGAKLGVTTACKHAMQILLALKSQMTIRRAS